MTPKDEISKRAASLRQRMQEEEFDAFIVPTGDPHSSEYVPDYWKVREWLTGFNGSAGTAVILKDKAALWTDSRYWLAAEEMLRDTPFTLMREGAADTPGIAEWLNARLPETAFVGFVGEMAASSFRDELEDGLRSGISLCAVPDSFCELWTDRPPLPTDPIVRLAAGTADVSALEKLNAIRKQVGLDADDAFYLMSDLADIAWTLNLRGNDIAYNPFFLSYMLVGKTSAILFADPEKVTPDVRAALADCHVTIEDYDEIGCFLSDMEGCSVFVQESLNCELVDTLCNLEMHVETVPPVVLAMRAVKSPAEQEGFRDAMFHDGRALVRFRRWLDETVPQGGVTELSADEKLTQLRAEEEGFAGLSFETIAAYGPHAAIVHYEATPETNAVLKPRGLLLLDTGAHYRFGTTDVTRTIALGALTEEEKRVYTLVLKGHIALSACQFPEGTNGLQLDAIARRALWKEGYDFGHGTGHGVGTKLGVHEGPHQIRKDKRACSAVPLTEGMTVTNEPGIYVAGSFGVRIENTMLVRRGKQTPFGNFLCFEPLTLCPIDTAPIDPALLTHEEAEWLNAYNAEVLRRLRPSLTDAADVAWLEAACAPIAI